MKIFIHPEKGSEIIVSDPNHYSIYERYGYEVKKITKPKKENTKK